MSLQVQISLCQSLCSDSLGIVKRLAVDSFQDIPWWLLRNFLLEKRISFKKLSSESALISDFVPL